MNCIVKTVPTPPAFAESAPNATLPSEAAQKCHCGPIQSVFAVLAAAGPISTMRKEKCLHPVDAVDAATSQAIPSKFD